VSDLIDPYLGSWDKEIIREIFWKRMLNIFWPSPSSMEGRIHWLRTLMTKVSSVKSAYHVVEDTKERERTRHVGNSSSMLEGDCGVRWQKLWKLTCPPKVKLFWWRLGHDSLPLRMNIMRRGMEIDTKCPVCWRLDEDGGHCFLKCKVVKKFWSHMNLEDTRIQLLSLNNAEEVVNHILSMNESDKLSVIGLLWAWWNAWN
jgi:hypothetical protein